MTSLFYICSMNDLKDILILSKLAARVGCTNAALTTAAKRDSSGSWVRAKKILKEAPLEEILEYISYRDLSAMLRARYPGERGFSPGALIQYKKKHGATFVEDHPWGKAIKLLLELRGVSATGVIEDLIKNEQDPDKQKALEGLKQLI